MFLLLVACDAEPVPVGPDAMPTPIVGSWRIDWECLDCLPGAINPLQYDDRLGVAELDGALVLSYRSSTCADETCAAEHLGATASECGLVEAGDDFGVDRGSYILCAIGGELRADITWSGYPGPAAPRTWRLSGHH